MWGKNMSKIYIIKKVFLYVFKISIAIFCIYLIMALIADMYGGAAIGIYLILGVVGLFYIIDYISKYNIR